MEKYHLEISELELILNELKNRNYSLIGPTVKDFAIVLDEIDSISDLPRGISDSQSPGKYKIDNSGSDSLFGYVVGPYSPKTYLHKSIQRYFSAERNGKTFNVFPEEPTKNKVAFIGIRACDIAAIKIQDKVFLESQYKDTFYSANRDENFILAVNCSVAGNNCFCTSFQTGPKSANNFDLSLTEVFNEANHFFLLEVGSDFGLEIISKLKLKSASNEEIKMADNVVKKTIDSISKKLDTNGLKELLAENFDHPHWDEVGNRCLNCGNCTMVCPTCFCVSVEDITDLNNEKTERLRKWDSCFTSDFTYIHGGSIRQSSKSRYRHWINHKLSTWVDQFGTFGCIGCGRCITWCPVGIDITEEASKIQLEEITK